MKLLLICDDIGITPSGIVIDNLIKGLLQTGDSVSVVCAVNASVYTHSNLNVYVSLRRKLKIKKISTLINLTSKYFPFFLKNKSWVDRSYKKHIDIFSGSSFDVVLGFGMAQEFALLYLSKRFSTKLKLPLSFHFLDAIPPPRGWISSKHERQNIKKIMQRYIQIADGITATNPEMLMYFKDEFTSLNNIPLSVVRNPCSTNKISRKSAQSSISFLYLGAIYGPRKLDTLLEAFEKLYAERKDIELCFVGTVSNINLDETKYQFIKQSSWTKDPESYLKNADVFVDIDADLTNDVFLSSKLLLYLNSEKLILSITGPNSPARNLLKGLNTVTVCHHDSDEIYIGISKLLENINNQTDFSERSSLINLFSLDNIIFDLSKHLEKVRENHI
ncbi:MAG: hypothetical protein ACOYO1_13035 [Bacteroidales bacterium]